MMIYRFTLQLPDGEVTYTSNDFYSLQACKLEAEAQGMVFNFEADVWKQDEENEDEKDMEHVETTYIPTFPG